jgi:hypothetical protein
MARILVTSDDGKATLVDERDVDISHLETPEGAGELLERLAWGIEDAQRRLGSRERPPRRRRVARVTDAPRRRLEAATSYDEGSFGD